ncbi:hypothetical protein KA005_78595, partial [bacterium]|nr:hypothetical protein [bacterium]
MTALQQFPEVVARDYAYIPEYIGELIEDTTQRETVSVEGALLAKANKDMLAFTQYTFPQYKADQFHQSVAGYLNQVVLGDIKNLMLFAPPQHGKLLAHETSILTANGWRKHGDLCVGDYVFGRNGQPVKVIALSKDMMGDIEVEFTDGAIIGCHHNHEWAVFDRTKHSAYRNQSFIYETKYMQNEGVWYGEAGKRGNRAKFQVDANVAVQMPDASLPIPPYVLGVWLGDGTANKNCITYHPEDSAIVEEFERLGFAETSLCVHKQTGIYTSYSRSLYAELRWSSVWDNKHIPDIYYATSIKQRLELLAGLIDSDGHAYQKNGRTTFSNTNEILVSDIAKLIATLGWRTSIVKYKPTTSTSGIVGKKPCYQVGFNPNLEIPCILKRKHSNELSPQ